MLGILYRYKVILDYIKLLTLLSSKIFKNNICMKSYFLFIQCTKYLHQIINGHLIYLLCCLLIIKWSKNVFLPLSTEWFFILCFVFATSRDRRIQENRCYHIGVFNISNNIKLIDVSHCKICFIIVLIRKCMRVTSMTVKIIVKDIFYYSVKCSGL